MNYNLQEKLDIRIDHEDLLNEDLHVHLLLELRLQAQATQNHYHRILMLVVSV